MTEEDKTYDKTEALKEQMTFAAGKRYKKPDVCPYSWSLNKHFVKEDGEMIVCPEPKLNRMEERMG